MARKNKMKKTKEEIQKKVENIRSIEEQENKQLAWFIGIVVIGFVVFLGTYFYLEKVNQPETFSYVGVNWTVENYENLVVYHARFPSYTYKNLMYNLYLRNDPRLNNVSVDGNLSFFKYDGVLAFTPEADQCSGIFEGSVTFASFMKSAIGIREVVPGTTDFEISQQTGRALTDCSINDGVAFIVQKGNESSIVQSPANKFCYTITIKDCDDILPLEKFIIETMRLRQKD